MGSIVVAELAVLPYALAVAVARVVVLVAVLLVVVVMAVVVVGIVARRNSGIRTSFLRLTLDEGRTRYLESCRHGNYQP